MSRGATTSGSHFIKKLAAPARMQAYGAKAGSFQRREGDMQAVRLGKPVHSHADITGDKKIRPKPVIRQTWVLIKCGKPPKRTARA